MSVHHGQPVQHSLRAFTVEGIVDDISEDIINRETIFVHTNSLVVSKLPLAVCTDSFGKHWKQMPAIQSVTFETCGVQLTLR